ncbi:hypothetical protein BGZ94_006091 [Podila epigama]|nr:hypothetical protein BGZ94_006091 [Podila epigama]
MPQPRHFSFMGPVGAAPLAARALPPLPVVTSIDVGGISHPHQPNPPTTTTAGHNPGQSISPFPGQPLTSPSPQHPSSPPVGVHPISQPSHDPQQTLPSPNNLDSAKPTAGGATDTLKPCEGQGVGNAGSSCIDSQMGIMKTGSLNGVNPKAPTPTDGSTLPDRGTDTEDTAHQNMSPLIWAIVSAGVLALIGLVAVMVVVARRRRRRVQSSHNDFYDANESRNGIGSNNKYNNNSSSRGGGGVGGGGGRGIIGFLFGNKSPTDGGHVGLSSFNSTDGHISPSFRKQQQQQRQQQRQQRIEREQFWNPYPSKS